MVSYLKSFLILLISTLVLGILGKPLKGKLYLGDSKTNIKKPFFKSYKIDEEFCHLRNKVHFNVDEIFNKCTEKDVKNIKNLFFIGDSHTYSLWQGAEFISTETNSNLFIFSGGGSLFPSVKYFREDNKDHLLKQHNLLYPSKRINF